MAVDSRRVYPLNKREPASGPVVYWMSRDQRVDDNWALIHAQEMALERRAPLAVVFTLAPSFLGATVRQYGFMLKGLSATARKLEQLRIPFFLLRGDPVDRFAAFIEQRRIAVVITDFDPLRIKRGWREQAARLSSASFVEVDAHNVVPCRYVSGKQEYGAYTIRPKIQRLLPEFLLDFPSLISHPFSWPASVQHFDANEVLKELPLDHGVGEVDWLQPGDDAGLMALRNFISEGLGGFGDFGNDPCRNGQSGLSPWLHFGQVSAQRVALETGKLMAFLPSVEAFLEELIVRRELSDNYCYYNPDYDRIAGAPDWARKTIGEHRRDRREYLYSREQFESSDTHDSLWNAAQRSMVVSGKMHGYLRMYWAKKIMEWSRTPDEAFETAIYLNDRYELDGRDPNGYAGIAWSIAGVHDRAWGERPVFGKIRYMSEKGCARKFDVNAYVRTWENNVEVGNKIFR